jgi:hypothetical protein
MKPLGAAILVATASGLQHFKPHKWTFSKPGGSPRRKPIRISRDTKTAVVEMKAFPNQRFRNAKNRIELTRHTHSRINQLNRRR